MVLRSIVFSRPDSLSSDLSLARSPGRSSFVVIRKASPRKKLSKKGCTSVEHPKFQAISVDIHQPIHPFYAAAADNGQAFFRTTEALRQVKSYGSRVEGALTRAKFWIGNCFFLRQPAFSGVH